jgi:glycogen debranching enzyme
MAKKLTCVKANKDGSGLKAVLDAMNIIAKRKKKEAHPKEPTKMIWLHELENELAKNGYEFSDANFRDDGADYKRRVKLTIGKAIQNIALGWCAEEGMTLEDATAKVKQYIGISWRVEATPSIGGNVTDICDAWL